MIASLNGSILCGQELRDPLKENGIAKSHIKNLFTYIGTINDLFLYLLLILSSYTMPVFRLTSDPQTITSLSMFGVSCFASFCRDFTIARGSVS